MLQTTMKRTLWGMLGVTMVAMANCETTVVAQVALRGARILTMAGEPIDSGVILIRDGRIEAVGADLRIPVEFKVLDVSGKIVMPGFVDVHTSGGMGQANERNPNVPFLSALDTIDAKSTFFEECRRNGITTAGISPGNSTMIGGQIAVLKTDGLFVPDMTLQRLVGVKISLRPPGGSRMSHLSALRRELNRAKKFKADGQVTAGEEGDTARDAEARGDAERTGDQQGGEAAEEGAQPATAAQQQEGIKILSQLIGGELLAVIYCDNAMDVGQALKLIEEFELRPMLVLGTQVDQAVELLKGKTYPVVLDTNLVFWRSQPRTRVEEKVSLPKLFNDAGVAYMFQAETNPSRATLGSNYLWYQAATAVKYGLSREQALAALTIEPARALGIDQWVGSIEPGKDADLVVLSGDPLSTTTWVEQTLIGGRVVYERSQDEKLRRLLEQPDQ